MNREFDDLESELSSLRPRQPSDGVRRGIADRLAREPSRTTTASTRVWRIAIVAVALAASVVIVAYSWRPWEDVPAPAPNPIARVEQVDTAPPPTWMAYRQVLGTSDESLDELLDHHGTNLLTSGEKPQNLGSLYQELLPN